MEYVQARQWWEELLWDVYSWNKYEDPLATDGEDWYGLSKDEWYAASQLCYSRRTWDLYKALSGEHPMERPDFSFKDWNAINNVIRDPGGDELKYSPLPWNVMGLDVVEPGGGTSSYGTSGRQQRPSVSCKSTTWKDLAKWE